MKRKIFTFIIGSICCLFSNAQIPITLTLRPDANIGKDAYLDLTQPNTNLGTHTDFAAIAWTNGGTFVLCHSVINFDISSIPMNATITNAKLFLYSYNSIANGSHSTMSGSNSSVLQRITSNWDENTVTWGTQPSTTTTNQVILPASTASIQDYTVDVTALVQDMTKAPLNSFGFMIKLQTEQNFRRLVFASSDNPDTSLHPKIEITYTIPVPTETKCLTLKPDANQGKDVYLDSTQSNINLGTHQDFAAIAWTNGGTFVLCHSVINFDISSIPMDATVTNAKLSFYSYNSIANGSHSTMSGSNSSVLQRITSNWDENTVTWGNQPSTTTNEAILPASTASIQDYTVDVTALVQDMVKDPLNSFGFMIKLQTEQNFRRLVFASSDNPDTSLHPKIEICYSLKTGIAANQVESNMRIYPNPVQNFIDVELKNNNEKVTINIFNSTGQLVKAIQTNGKYERINLSDSPRGLYLVKISFNDNIQTQKIIIQ